MRLRSLGRAIYKMTTTTTHVPMCVGLKLRRVARPELVCVPGDYAYSAPPDPVLEVYGAPKVTHLLHLCDHYATVHVVPCTTGPLRDGLWKLMGSMNSPSVRPTLTLTHYRGAIADGALTPDMEGRQ
jgi:hypothetical protein